ncbi:MAG: hypothetical protein WBA66_09550 [Xanthobacteraceae bacterium]
MRTALIAGAVMVVLPLMAPPAGAVELPRGIAQLYSSVSILPPTARTMTVCYGFVCRRRAALDFGAADRGALTRILAAGRSSPVAERRAVQNAVVWFDRRMGPLIGTDKRVARADFRSGSDRANYDCWDTTRNVTSLLLVLRQWGLLRHHDVGEPRYRGNVLKMQTPHNTAVLVEKATGANWVVDMWTRAYAQAPEVMPAAQWAQGN